MYINKDIFYFCIDINISAIVSSEETRGSKCTLKSRASVSIVPKVKLKFEINEFSDESRICLVKFTGKNKIK